MSKDFVTLETAYGSLALFTSIIHNIFLLYHVDIFVSVYKIDKFSFWVGELIFLAWNSLNDPLFGWFSDKKFLLSNKKNDDVVWTRLKTLHVYGPLLTISFILFWVSWAVPGVQFVVCLCLYDGFLTVVDLHHSALLADLAISANVRTKLNSKCSIFSALGSSSVFLSYMVWNKSDLSFFRVFCVGLACFSFLGYLLMVGTLKKLYKEQQLKEDSYIQQDNDDNFKESEKLKEWDTLVRFGKQLLSHKNFLWFAIINLVQVFHCHFNSNFFPLFLDTLLGGALSPALVSIILGASFVAPHLNNLYFLTLCRKYGVYHVIKGLFIIKFVLTLVMFAAGSNHIWLLCLFIASNRVFTEGTCKLLGLVISDLVDEDTVLHQRGRAVSALIFGTAALLSKPGQTLAPLIGTMILTLQTGHDIFLTGNKEGSLKLDMQSLDKESMSSYRDGVFLLLLYIPFFCALVQLSAWSRFTLHGNRLAQIKAARQGVLYIKV